VAQSSPPNGTPSGDQPLATETETTETASSTVEDLKQKMALVEASLYVAGRPLELKTLRSITGITSKKKLQSIAHMLADEYRKRDGALEILELEDERLVMQLKSRYVSRVRRLSIRPLLTEGPLRTLSYIAYRQPVPQAKVILVRGSQAYDHINELSRMGLIVKEKFGKSQLLRTTDLFADHFSLGKDLRLLKKQLEAIYAQTSTAKKGEAHPPEAETTSTQETNPEE